MGAGNAGLRKGSAIRGTRVLDNSDVLYPSSEKGKPIARWGHKTYGSAKGTAGLPERENNTGLPERENNK